MKIGFIDYFLSEWHANSYPKMIQQFNEKSGKNLVVSHAYAALDISPYDGVTTEQWCKKYNVRQCASIGEVCENVDAIIILSPDNPEHHLAMCSEAFVYGKPVYVDKTFAPSKDIALKIFELAKKHNTPIFSSSALRYATELSEYKKPLKTVFSMGGGGAIERYVVHQLEMVQRLMGCGAKRVQSFVGSTNKCAVIDYGNDRFATISYSPKQDFNIALEDEDKNTEYLPIRSDFFAGLIAATAEFFESKVPPVDMEATVEIMAIIDAILISQENLYKWVNV